MPISTLSVCALIPTYNNAGTVIDVIQRTHQYMENIIVVNDGSTDHTAQLLQTLSFPVTIISYPHNKGKGHALREGFREAQRQHFTHVLTLDADGQHYPEDIPSMLRVLRANPCAMIVGSRQLQQENMPARNTFANRFSNFWFTFQTGLHLPDTQTGMRIYPMRYMKGLSLLTSRYEAELELLVFMAWANVRIIPVPVRVYYPPKEQRVSHFRPAYDFTRISLLNTVLCLLAIVYGLPRRYCSTLLYILVFLTLAILLQPVALFCLLFGRRSKACKRLFHTLFTAAAKAMTYMVGCRFKSRDSFRLSSEPTLYICNHQSLLDILILLSRSPRLLILTKGYVRRNPFFGLLVRYADFPTVEDDMDSNISTLEPLIRQGYSLLVFPEGTRSPLGLPARFHKGAFYLAEHLYLPLQPLLLQGTGTILPKHQLHIYRGDFSLETLQPIALTDIDYRSLCKAYGHLYKQLFALQ